MSRRAQKARPTRPAPARADLHLHSTCSDGLLAPAAMMDRAADARCAVVALTDHDTFAGLAEARERAEARGMEFIPGVEISTRDPRGAERHLLAYCVDPGHAGLAAELLENVRARAGRVQAMVEALVGAGVEIDANDVLAEAQGSVGRPHVADALVRKGHVRTRQEAFDRWLGDGKIAHVAKRNVDIDRAIALVHEAGGVAVLAHPGRRWDPTLVEELVGLGLDGVEAHHPANVASAQAALVEIARRMGLLVTGGSDCHGDADGLHELRAGKVPRELADAVVERATRRRDPGALAMAGGSRG